MKRACCFATPEYTNITMRGSQIQAFRCSIAPVVSYRLDQRSRLILKYTWQRSNKADVGSFYVFSAE
ncbi:MAG: hypothetical protein AB7V25_17020, partial [Mangrovibacterium sp.]